MSQRKTLPRVEIRRADDAPGEYPSVVRTGDPTRKGRQSIYFDDTSTIIFELPYDIAISWPSTLPLRGNVRNDFTSSITTTGKTIKSSVGDLNNLPTFVEPLGPFNEIGLHEQIERVDSFHQTGSELADVGFGMSSKLKSKTIVRFKLPVAIKTTFRESSASLYYYDRATNSFVEPVPTDAGPAAARNQFQFVHLASDTKLFGPFGNFAISGSEFVPYFGIRPQAQVKNSLFDAMQYQHGTASVLTDTRYRPSDTQRIRMSDYISHPFIIEKAIIEVPIEAGSTWFADRTQLVPNNGFDNVPDAGGPCVTVGLINVVGGDRRDLILSSTIIPVGDDFASALNFVSNSQNYRSLHGFRSFSKPGAVVSPAPNNTFTGSVVALATSQVRNALISYGAPPITNRSWSAINFRDSYIGSFDPFGRGSVAEPCGRSILGKEFTAPQITNFNLASLNKKVLGSLAASTFDYPEMYLFESYAASPYIVYPNDNLLLTISKHRPAISVDSNFNSLLRPTGSHDIKVNTGSVYLTLFGSLLRNGTEVNDGHNPQLTSNAVHEMIGSDPIYDEYDVSYKEELRGNYVTEYVSGSIYDNTSSGRARWRSSLDSNATARLGYLDRTSDRRRFIYHLVSFRRYTEANSTVERFYDSLVPSIDEVMKKGRNFSRLYAWRLFGTLTKEVIVVNLDSNQYLTLYAAHSSNDWSRSFPFEPRYSHIKRSTTQKFFARQLLDSFYFIGNFWGRYYDMNDNIVVKVGVANNLHNIGVDLLNPDSPSNQLIGLKNEVAMKLLYGVGDWNNCYNAPVGGGSKLFGAVDRPLMIENVATNSYAGVEIRGWKYGLANANPQYSKNIWRRDHYGQFRDMLEQRIDTKFFLTNDDSDISARKLVAKKNSNFAGTAVVIVKFVNTSGSVVRPEETYSSNLSFEATSSLPYYDGYVRNREDPLFTSRIQQFQYLGS